MNNKKLQVIILNYNNFEDTLALVEILDKQIFNFFGITIVDNFSSDNSYINLQSALAHREDIDLIHAEVNGGYAKGNNLGLKSLIANPPEYVAILNNDIKINNHQLFNQLVQIFEKLYNPGLIAPAQVDNDGNIYHHSAWKFPRFIHDILSSFWLYRKFYKKNLYSIDSRQTCLKVDLLPGSFLFGKFQYFRNVNFFDDNTFLFLEERILYAKAKKYGYQNYLIPNLNYVHQSSSTIDKEIKLMQKYDVLHDSLLYYTFSYRSNGKLKTQVLRFFLNIKMAEINLINTFQKAHKIWLK